MTSRGIYAKTKVLCAGVEEGQEEGQEEGLKGHFFFNSRQHVVAPSIAVDTCVCMCAHARVTGFYLLPS